MFLVNSGCDVNSPRRPLNGPGRPHTKEDLLTPLHMCASWGLDLTAVALAQHGAKLNAKVRIVCNIRRDRSMTRLLV